MRYICAALLLWGSAAHATVILSSGQSATYLFNRLDPPHTDYQWIFTDYTMTALFFEIDFYDSMNNLLGTWRSGGTLDGPAIAGGDSFDSPWTTQVGTARISVSAGLLTFERFGMCFDGGCPTVNDFNYGIRVRVPEPSSFWLLLVGLGWLWLRQVLIAAPNDRRSQLVPLSTARQGLPESPLVT